MHANLALPLPPDTRQGLPNLMASLTLALGGSAPSSPPLAALEGLLDDERPLVLLVVDGMGEAQLQRHLPQGLLQRGRLLTLESVFPSTTASAVGTLITGLPPVSHGLTGWHVWVEEIQELLAILPLVRRQGPPPQPGEREAWARSILAAPDLPLPLPLASRISCHLPSPRPKHPRPQITHVAPSAILYSPFNRELARGAEKRGYHSLNGLFERLQEALAESPDGRPHLLYAYWPDFDTLAHQHGPDSAIAGLALQTLEQALEGWLAQLPQGPMRPRVLVTADHGFIHAPPERLLCLNDYPELHRLLRQPLSGERRATYAHLQPGQMERFITLAEERLGHALWICPSQQLLEQGWFGQGPRHPHLDSRIGDLTLLLKDDWTLRDSLPGEREHRMLGMHGGVSPAERLVPLCLFD